MRAQQDNTSAILFEAYTFERLFELLCKYGRSRPLAPEGKLHLTYFREYFEHFLSKGPVTIGIEPRYVDRDFLEDYAAYYARCFPGKYPGMCARLHFFRGQLSQDQFQAAVECEPNAPTPCELNEAYLGFIVVRPLPHAFIGRTCLKTYDDDNGRRHYPVTRCCDAHLLGFNFGVESLPFQEQDKAAAACATSAIWSALQGTARLFQHASYSPVEITRIATREFPGLRRAFPNKGLNPQQMAAAIRNAGLEPELMGVDEETTLQVTAYAYLRAGIPVLLNVALFDFSQPDHPKPFRGDWEIGHAVAATGFSMGRNEPVAMPKSGTLVRASRMDRLYVHDDQLGPFARLVFGGPKGDYKSCGRPFRIPFSLKSSWPDESGGSGTVSFVPEAIIVPVYHKIRVGVDTILTEVWNIEERYRTELDLDLPEIGVEWDIYLTTSAEFKRDLQRQPGLRPDRRWEVLSTSLPRFLWMASAYIDQARLLDLVYDATDVAESPDLLVQRIDYELT